VRVCRRAILTILTAGIVGSGAAASAQTPEQFYTGKTIDFVIGYPPGGSNDTLGRLLARHLGKHIRETRRSCRRTSPAPAASSR
jgi:tripartite-type tricarboxylate transporter receptor subunit TctC